MNWIQLLSIIYLFASTFKIDFTSLEDNDWYIVNDGVMGGLSKGKVSQTDDGVLFYGKVSLQNNGGFTSYRSDYQNYDLTPFKEVIIRYRSQGIEQAFQMEVDRRFYIPNFQIHLPNTDGWETKSFRLMEVKQHRLGNPTGNLLTRDQLDEIIRIGFITDEKKAGDFSFEVDYIEFK